MVGKHNKRLLTEKMGKRVTRWGIRRLNVGVASIAIATGLLLSAGISDLAQAAEITDGDATTISEKVNEPNETSLSTVMTETVTDEGTADQDHSVATEEDKVVTEDQAVETEDEDTTAHSADKVTSADDVATADKATPATNAKAETTAPTDKDTAHVAKDTEVTVDDAVQPETAEMTKPTVVVKVDNGRANTLTEAEYARLAREVRAAASIKDPATYPQTTLVPETQYIFGGYEVYCGDQSQNVRVVLSVDRLNPSAIYIYETDLKYGTARRRYSVEKNKNVTSQENNYQIQYYNDGDSAAVRIIGNDYTLKNVYDYGTVDANAPRYSNWTLFVPEIINQTIKYQDQSGNEIETVIHQQGLTGQVYTTDSDKVIDGYYQVGTPDHANGSMSQFGEIGRTYTNVFHDQNGARLEFTQLDESGKMHYKLVLENRGGLTYEGDLEKGQSETINGGNQANYFNYTVTNPYIDQTANLVYTYDKLGNLIPVDKDGQPIPGAKPVPYPNDPTDPTKPGKPLLPEIPGYTPVDDKGQPLTPGTEYPIDPNKPGEDTPVHYVANQQNAVITFIDDVTGETIHVDNINGEGGTTSNYTTADQIKAFENQGYKLVSDNYPENGVVFDKDDTQDQTFEVHFVHQTKPVTPENPSDVDVSELVDDINQTVQYVDEKGNPLSGEVTDKVTFERTGIKDLVTGKVTFGDWKAKDDDNTFNAKTSPVIQGYYAEKEQVEASTVAQGDKDQTIKVVYHQLGNLIPVDENGQPMPGVKPVPYPNDPTDPTKPGLPVIPNIPGYTPVDDKGQPLTPGETYPIDTNTPGKDTSVKYIADNQKATITFVDETTGQNIEVVTKDGKTGEKIDYSTADKIQELINQGYELVSDDYPKDGAFYDNDKTKDQQFTVVLKHKVIPITPDKPGEPNKPVDPDNPDGPNYPDGTDKDSLVQDVNQTIHYVDNKGNKVAEDVTNTVTFEREGSVDLVTGKVTYTDWKPVNGDDTFAVKKSPVINGYYADKAQVDESKVTVDDKDQEINVVYNKLGNLVPDVPGVDPVPYPNNPDDPTKPGLPVIPDVPGHTPIGPDGKPLKPGDTYPINPEKPGEDTPIHYEADGQEVIVHYFDKTTGKDITVDTITGKTGEKVNYSTANKIQELINQGYQLVEDGYPKDGVVYDDDKNTKQEFTVTLEHRVVPVTPDKPGEPNKPVDPDNPDGPKYPEGTDKDSLVQDVNQTIHYVDNKGNKVAEDVTDTVTFEREGSVDLVTGKVTYTDWKPVNGDDTFAVKKSPVINGYYADKAQVNESKVTVDDKDQEINVIYNKLGNLVPDVPGVDPVPYPNNPDDPTKPGLPVIPDIPGHTPIGPDGKPLKPGDTYPINPEKPGEDTPIHYEPNKEVKDQQAIVQFVDDKTGELIQEVNLSGKAGTTSDYRTDKAIQDLINKGYEFISNDYPENGVVFDEDDNTVQKFTVHFTHKVVPVTPDKPGEPNKPVDPNNPDGPKYPEGTDVNSLTDKVTQIIHYVDKDGNPLTADVTDEVRFERTGTIDLVTGKITYSDWKAVNDDNIFDIKDSPVINGYYADQAQVAQVTVTPDMENQEITVVYHKLGHLIPDVPGVDPVPYPNDPTDPTKPGQPIIPDVPGYTPVGPDGTPLKPGDPYPIDPNHPGMDTPIHYVPNQMPVGPDHENEGQPIIGRDDEQVPDDTEQTDQQQANLPQTGAATDKSLTWVGSALLAIAGALQLGGISKKRKED